MLLLLLLLLLILLLGLDCTSDELTRTEGLSFRNAELAPFSRPEDTSS